MALGATEAEKLELARAYGHHGDVRQEHLDAIDNAIDNAVEKARHGMQHEIALLRHPVAERIARLRLEQLGPAPGITFIHAANFWASPILGGT